MNLFGFNIVEAVRGLAFAFLWGVTIGFFIGLIRYIFFSIVEKDRY